MRIEVVSETDGPTNLTLPNTVQQHNRVFATSGPIMAAALARLARMHTTHHVLAALVKEKVEKEENVIHREKKVIQEKEEKEENVTHRKAMIQEGNAPSPKDQGFPRARNFAEII